MKLRKGQSTKIDVLRAKDEASLSTLQERIVTPPMLATKKSTGKLTEEKDDCDTNVGYVILSKQTEGPKIPTWLLVDIANVSGEKL